MPEISGFYSYAAEGQKSLGVSLLDIDIALRDIVYQRYHSPLNFLGRDRPPAVEDYAIEGAVHLPARDGDGYDEASLVYVSGYDTIDADGIDADADWDHRSPCYISTDRQMEYSWCTNIFIQNRVFRRLVELYSSKRIDALRLTVKLHIVRGPSENLELPTLTFPMLGPSGGLSFQHVRCQLLSVYTSRHDLDGGPEQAQPTAAFATRLGRWQA